MTRDEWARHYTRLCTTYGRSQNAEQASAYFDVLGHFPDLCVQQAVQRHVREGKHWPVPADLVEFAREERNRLSTPTEEHTCPECHGSLWVPGPPRYDFGNTYETVMKCPTCRPQARKQGAA
jgi:hypothetical protein